MDSTLRMIEEMKREDARIQSSLFAVRNKLKFIEEKGKPLTEKEQLFVRDLHDNKWNRMTKKVSSIHSEVFNEII